MRNASLSSVLVALALLAMCAQAAGETWGADYVLLVDNTGTMRYGNRGAMTIEAIEGFVDQTQVGDRVSVYSYGEASTSELPEWPVTIRDQVTRDWLKDQLSFSFSADRTDITSGMELVWSDRDRVFPDRSQAREGSSVLVVMTDGKLIPNYSDYSQYDSIYHRSRARLQELAGLFDGEGVAIHTIAVGREDKVDGDLMARVASKARGSYTHAETADAVSAAFCSALIARPAEPVRSVEAAEDVPADEVTREPARAGGWSVQDNARADEVTPRGTATGTSAEVRGNSWLDGFPVEACYRITGALAILVGVVAVGSEKRRKWAAHFTADLFGTGEMRVRGFLKPIDPPGVATARPCIGLENPGLDKVVLGVDASMPAHADNAEIMFVGTKDGSPPTMVVQSGKVTLNGEQAEKVKLADGDIVEIEGLQYQYLRGSRR